MTTKEYTPCDCYQLTTNDYEKEYGDQFCEIENAAMYSTHGETRRITTTFRPTKVWTMKGKRRVWHYLVPRYCLMCGVSLYKDVEVADPTPKEQTPV